MEGEGSFLLMFSHHPPILQEYTNLHRDIMSGAAPPKVNSLFSIFSFFSFFSSSFFTFSVSLSLLFFQFLVSTCGKYLQKNQGRSHGFSFIFPFSLPFPFLSFHFFSFSFLFFSDCSGLGNQLEVLEALLIASIVCFPSLSLSFPLFSHSLLTPPTGHKKSLVNWRI